MKRLNRNLHLIFILVFCISNGYSQQDPSFTQYWNTQNYFNPGTVGTDYRIQSQIIYRNQWAKLNYPFSVFNANYSMSIKQNHGVGINFLNYQIAQSKLNRVKLNYAYHKQFKNELKLSIGLAATYSNLSMNPNNSTVLPSDSNYIPIFNTHSLTADIGTYLRLKKLNVGLSIIQLNGSQLLKSSTTLFERIHFYGFVNYTFGKETGFQIQPNLLVKSDFIFKELNLNLLLKYKSKLMLGAGIRSRDSFSFFAGYDFYKKYRIAYSLNMTVSQLNNSFGGTHEFCLAYLLK